MYREIMRFGKLDQLAFVSFVSFFDRKLTQKELESVKAFHSSQMNSQKSSFALLRIRPCNENLHGTAVYLVRHDKNLLIMLYICFNIKFKRKIKVCIYCLFWIPSHCSACIALLVYFSNYSALYMINLNFCILPLKKLFLPSNFDF